MINYARLRQIQEARRARLSVGNFAHFVAPNEYRFNWHHDLLYDRLDAFARGECKRLIVQMPPGHGKSEGVSRNLPAYLLGLNPNNRVIACSYNSDLASEMNRDVQKIMDSERYRDVFPKTRLGGKVRHTAAGFARRNSDIFDVVGARGYYKCAGVGKGITGRRFDLGIIDDPIKDRATANSPVLREWIWRWYTGSFLNRRAKGASICITLTRWHDDDLVGRLLIKEPGMWEVISLPAIANLIDPHPADKRKVGEALWPWFQPIEDLEKTRELEPRDFWALYQQDPQKEGGSEWPRDWFDDVFFDDDVGFPPDIICKVLALDPSKGKTDRSGDYSAWIKLGVDRDWCLWVDADLDNVRTVEPLASRPGYPSIVGDGYQHALDFRPQAILIETNGFQEMVATAFMHYAQARNAVLPIYTIDHTDPKVQRIKCLGRFFAQRKFRVKNNRGGRLLVQQLRDFPLGEFDDGPDALATALEMAMKLIDNMNSDSGNMQMLIG